MSTRELSHCAEAVRRLDRDRWLTLLFAHPGDREALAALYAFNQEIARVRDRVSEPMLGAIRLEWWRESLRGSGAGAVRRHPVVEALAVAIAARDLPEEELLALVDAREQDLDGEGFRNLNDLVAYCEATGGGLSRLAARVCGAVSAEVLDAATAVGTGWALTGLLRALAFEAAQRRTVLPGAVLARAGLARGALFRGSFPEPLRPVAADMADRARQAFVAARRARRHIPPRARNGFLLATLASDYLRRLARAGNDPFRAAFERGIVGRRMRVLWAALRARY
ncbi:MAG: phytoene/squalene synthase family protein [Rhodothalassiaceae bacterium]